MALIVLGLLLCGCSLLGPRTFEITLHAGTVEPRAPLPVTLVDATGTVVGIQAGPDAQISELGAAPLAGDPNGIVVSWFGGACDTGISFRLEDREGGLRLTGKTSRAGGVCILIALSRRMVVRFLAPVDASKVTVAVA